MKLSSANPMHFGSHASGVVWLIAVCLCDWKVTSSNPALSRIAAVPVRPLTSELLWASRKNGSPFAVNPSITFNYTAQPLCVTMCNWAGNPLLGTGPSVHGPHQLEPTNKPNRARWQSSSPVLPRGVTYYLSSINMQVHFTVTYIFVGYLFSQKDSSKFINI